MTNLPTGQNPVQNRPVAPAMHSPLPWRVYHWSSCEFAVVDAKGNRIAELDCCGLFGDDAANAALIVRAVNRSQRYEALIAEAKMVIRTSPGLSGESARGQALSDLADALADLPPTDKP